MIRPANRVPRGRQVCCESGLGAVTLPSSFFGKPVTVQGNSGVFGKIMHVATTPQRLAAQNPKPLLAAAAVATGAALVPGVLPAIARGAAVVFGGVKQALASKPITAVARAVIAPGPPRIPVVGIPVLQPSYQPIPPARFNQPPMIPNASGGSAFQPVSMAPGSIDEAGSTVQPNAAAATAAATKNATGRWFIGAALLLGVLAMASRSRRKTTST